MKYLDALLFVLLAIVSGCAAEPNQTAETAKAIEGEFICLRIQGPGERTPVVPGLAAPRLTPGNRVFVTNAEWKQLWHSARQRLDTDPPTPIPDGFLGVAVTISGGLQVHPHIRRVSDDGKVMTVETQTEVRNFPDHNGDRKTVSDSDFLDTLVVFLPANPKMEIRFQTLPNLVWTPETDDETEDSSPCEYRR